MKKIVILATAAISMAACNNKKETVKENDMGKSVLDIQAMDTSVRPQDDFYNFVNGGWMKTATIPSDRSNWGSFAELREKTDQNCLTLLNELIAKEPEKGSEAEKIKQIYQAYIDLEKREQLGLKPIEEDLSAIDKIGSLKDLQKFIAENPTLPNPFYGWEVYPDMKNSSMNIAYLNPSGLGLGRDYFQKEDESNKKTLERYKKYVADILKAIGHPEAEKAAENIVGFEKEMAKAMLTNEQIRDANLQYTPKTMDELKKMVKNVDIPAYLTAIGIKTDKIVLSDNGFTSNLDKFVNEKNIPLIKDYLKYVVVSDNASLLNKQLDELQFDFYSKYMRGQEKQRSIDKRGLSLVNGVLGEAFGKVYVEEYFPAKSKENMIELIDYLKKSFALHIDNLQWMSDQTKVKAHEKLNTFMVKVGYPDKWKDYSSLEIVEGNLYQSLKNVRKWTIEEAKSKIGKEVDKSQWEMSPQTVNAYYNPLNNEIVFPAAILQPPFFYPEGDPAMNFGAIGGVIGHEMTHGFDDSGAAFDSKGNLSNWWSKEDEESFKKVTDLLAKEYSKYEPVKGHFINGVFTNGENIADLGGASISYDALEMYLKDKGNVEKIDNFTQEQRFFISWATVWRIKATEKSLIDQVKTDPHSPGYFRAFGPLVNIDAFYQAFNVKEGDKHYKKPEDRIRIW